MAKVAPKPVAAEENLDWMKTQDPTETARKYKYQVFVVPRKPPNIPFAFPGKGDEYEWIYPGPSMIHSKHANPFELNGCLYRCAQRGAKLVVVQGFDVKQQLHTGLYFERGPSWMANYQRWVDDRAYYFDYYGVPEGATDNAEDPIVRLNPIFFTECLFESKPIVPGYTIEKWDMMQKASEENGPRVKKKREGKPRNLEGTTTKSGLFIPPVLR